MFRVYAVVSYEYRNRNQVAIFETQAVAEEFRVYYTKNHYGLSLNDVFVESLDVHTSFKIVEEVQTTTKSHPVFDW